MHRILPFIFCLFASSLTAQYERGNWWLNAASGLSWDSAPFDNGDLLSPNLQGGYLFADRWLIGASISRPGFDKLSLITETRLTPFLRRYFPSLKNPRLHYFVELGLGVSLESEGVMPQAAVGLEYQLSTGVMLNGSLSGGTTLGDRGFGPAPSAAGLQLVTSILFGGINDADNKGEYFLRKGDFLLAGSLGNLIYNWRPENNDILSGNLQFSAGYMLSDQIMLEGAANIEVSDFSFTGNIESAFDSETSSGFFSLGLRYQLIPGARFQPYLAGGMRYDYWNFAVRWMDGPLGREDFEIDEDGLGLYTNAGFLYFLRDNVALDFSLGYRASLTSDLFRQSNGQLIGGVGTKLFLGTKAEKRPVEN